MSLQSQLDEDANIWRLVSRDPERRHVNLGGGSTMNFDEYSTTSSSKSQVSTQKKQKQGPRLVLVLALAVGCLALITAVGVARQLYRGNHRGKYAQQSPSTTHHSSDDVSLTKKDRLHLSRASSMAEFNPLQTEISPPVTTTAIAASLDQSVPIVTSHAKWNDLNGYGSTLEPLRDTDTPVFFNIAYQLTGARIFKDILGVCHHLASASSDVRLMLKDLPQDKIQIVHSEDPDKQRLALVSVDTTIISELVRAQRLGLAQSGLADFIMVRHLYQANNLFDLVHKGRIFAVFRQPVQAAWGAYLAIEHTHPELEDMTFEDYADSDQVENNWLTRALSNQPMDAVLTDEHLQIAIQFVQQKILVGLLSKRDESLERFEKYFEWKFKEDPVSQEQCRSDFLDGVGRERQMQMAPAEDYSPKVALPMPGSPIYDKLAEKNSFDMKLYDEVVKVFEEQQALVATTPDGYRLDNATCCKCDNTCSS